MTCVPALALMGLCLLPPSNSFSDTRMRDAASCFVMGGGEECFRDVDRKQRDQRCDTPARYQAMSEGADCTEEKK